MLIYAITATSEARGCGAIAAPRGGQLAAELLKALKALELLKALKALKLLKALRD